MYVNWDKDTCHVFVYYDPEHRDNWFSIGTLFQKIFV
jgi:hypothetical protein